MAHDKPIKLRVANKRDFVFPFCVLFLLVVLSAGLSPLPFIVTLLALLVFGTLWLIYTLDLHNVNTLNLTSVIFPDGHVQLISNRDDTIEVFLDSQQWCTHWLAVLRVVNGGSIHRLVILSIHQQQADDFRRLNMWLRQNICNGMIKRQVSLS